MHKNVTHSGDTKSIFKIESICCLNFAHNCNSKLTQKCYSKGDPQRFIKKWSTIVTQRLPTNDMKILARIVAQSSKLGPQMLLKKWSTNVTQNWPTNVIQKSPANVTKEVILKRCSKSDQLKVPKIDQQRLLQTDSKTFLKTDQRL